MEDDPSTSVSIHTTAGSDNSNIHDDCSAAAAVTAAKAAATKAQRMKNFKKKKKSVHSRHQNGGNQKGMSYDYDAARSQMGNATANAQQLRAVVILMIIEGNGEWRSIIHDGTVMAMLCVDDL